MTAFPRFDSASTVCVVRNSNQDYQRMKALVSLTNTEYRQDVISNNLQDFIIKGKVVPGLIPFTST